MGNDDPKDPIMTKEEIVLIASKAPRGFSEQTMNILTDLLFYKMPQPEIAEKYKITQQAVDRARVRLYKLRDKKEVQTGFQRVLIHPSLQKKLDKLVEESKALYKI